MTRAERSAARAAEDKRIASVIAAARDRGCNPRMPRDEKVEAAPGLRAEGLSCRQIGVLLGVTGETVRLWLKDAATRTDDAAAA